jgi:hypothetical protein
LYHHQQTSFRGACDARSAACASFDVQLHIRESITTAWGYGFRACTPTGYRRPAHIPE